jgi:hypothetical protein
MNPVFARVADDFSLTKWSAKNKKLNAHKSLYCLAVRQFISKSLLPLGFD